VLVVVEVEFLVQEVTRLAPVALVAVGAVAITLGSRAPQAVQILVAVGVVVTVALLRRMVVMVAPASSSCPSLRRTPLASQAV